MDELRIEANPKWIRGMSAGTTVVDSRSALLVWEIPYYPAWYIPLADVSAEFEANGATFESSTRGHGTRYDLHLPSGKTLPDAAWRHLGHPELKGHVRLEWDAVDTWLEEETEVFVHPRSPDVRVDALPSSRHVVVRVDETTVADSHRPTILFETGLPTRFYLPKSDVRLDLLTPTSTESACPYKGWANYWTVTIDLGGDERVAHEDLAWGYRTPLPESEAIAGLICFYNEKVEIEVDGQILPQPITKFA